MDGLRKTTAVLPTPALSPYEYPLATSGHATSTTTTTTSDKLSRLSSIYLQLAQHSRYDAIYLVGLVLVELIFGYLIIQRVSYTEIDWLAYMQEVECWYVDNVTDYRKIQGDTGPLVYPAGFLYLFALLRNLTDEGRNIPLAQNIFLGFYVATQALVLLLYTQVVQQTRRRTAASFNMADAHHVWSWRIAMALVCCSKRLHSIYLLRLFNDGPTMMLLYLSILLLTQQRHNMACVVFSLAVSIKMNVLLFAPGLLLLLLQIGPNVLTVFLRLLLCCAVPQLLLGAPFLLTYPESYLRKAFELDRTFFYEWTVNWKFVTDTVFVAHELSLLLLVLHVLTLLWMARRWLQAASYQETGTRRSLALQQSLAAVYMIDTMLVSNYIGIVFARSLHYQFYSWYIQAVPFLLWQHARIYPVLLRVALWAALEYGFLTFPATPLSSAIVQVAHVAILLPILVSGPPQQGVVTTEKEAAESAGPAVPVTSLRAAVARSPPLVRISDKKTM